MNRGEIWWADLPDPVKSEPGFRRPLLIIQANSFNKSKINTVICAVITSNLKLGEAPGNILLTGKSCGLPKDSVINISQIITIDKSYLVEKVGELSSRKMNILKDSLNMILDLE